ncbi:MAG: efflux RND transporter periplasmic adaptor subunit [Gammaproteobacteria bacterium]
MSVLGALALIAVIVRMLAGHGSAAQVELVAVDIGPVRPVLRSDPAATVEACVVPAATIPAGGRVQRVLARPGQQVRRGTLLAELEEEEALIDGLGRARREARAASVAAREDCRRSPLREKRRDRLAETRRESIALASETGRAGLQGDWNACAQARREVSSAIGRLSGLRSDLERFKVRAAFDGTLTAVNVVPGDLLQAGANAPIELARNGCLAVRMRVPAPAAGNAGALERHASACVRLAAGSDRLRCDAVVRSVDTGHGQGGKSAEIVVEFSPDAGDPATRPGAAATVEIPLAARERATRVPVTAVTVGGGVLVFDAGRRTLRERTIRTGVADDLHVEVLSGLEPGERVARSPGTLAVGKGEQVVPAGSVP